MDPHACGCAAALPPEGAEPRLGAAIAELAQRVTALSERMRRLEPPSDRPRPVIFPTYGGCRRTPNLTALVALLLRRYQVPVLIHGSTDRRHDFGRVTTAAVLAELGIDPVHSIDEAQRRIGDGGIALVPTSVLFDDPELERAEPMPDVLHAAIRLVDPFGGCGFRIVTASQRQARAEMRAFLVATRADALLLRGSEGEPFASPRTPTPLEWFEHGEAHTLDGNESSAFAAQAALPAVHDATTTARWTAAALSGETPIPLSTLNQLACCLLGARLRDADSE